LSFSLFIYILLFSGPDGLICTVETFFISCIAAGKKRQFVGENIAFQIKFIEECFVVCVTALPFLCLYCSETPRNAIPITVGRCLGWRRRKEMQSAAVRDVTTELHNVFHLHETLEYIDKK